MSVFVSGDPIDSIQRVSFIYLFFSLFSALRNKTVNGSNLFCNKRNIVSYSALTNVAVSVYMLSEDLICIIRAVKCDSTLQVRKKQMTKYAEMCLFNQMSWLMVIS